MKNPPAKKPSSEKMAEPEKRPFFIRNPIVRRIVRYVLLVLIMGIIAHLMMAERNIYKKTVQNMGIKTECCFYVTDKDADTPIFELVRTANRETDLLCSTKDPASTISDINDNAFREPVRCPDPLWDILCTVRKISALSGGAFSITAGTAGMDKIVFDDAAHTVRFTEEGVKLDLSSILNGIKLDHFSEKAATEKLAGNKLASAATFMEKAEAWFRNRYVSLDCGHIGIGNCVRVFPEPPPEGQEYTALVRNPQNPGGPVLARAKMLDECFAVKNEAVDPRTGLPVKNVLSVSVIAKSGIVADALATAVFVGGRSVADAAVKEYPGLRVLAFYADPKTGKIGSWQIGEWDDVTVPDTLLFPDSQPEKIKTIPVMTAPGK